MARARADAHELARHGRGSMDVTLELWVNPRRHGGIVSFFSISLGSGWVQRIHCIVERRKEKSYRSERYYEHPQIPKRLQNNSLHVSNF